MVTHFFVSNPMSLLWYTWVTSPHRPVSKGSSVSQRIRGYLGRRRSRGLAGAVTAHRTKQPLASQAGVGLHFCHSHC